MFRTLRAAGLLLVVLATGCSDECEKVRVTVGDPVIGQFVYDNQCKQCHGAQGFGSSGPDLVELLPALTTCDLVESVREGGNAMPAYDRSDISTEDLNDLIEYMTLEFQ